MKNSKEYFYSLEYASHKCKTYILALEIEILCSDLPASSLYVQTFSTHTHTKDDSLLSTQGRCLQQPSLPPHWR